MSLSALVFLTVMFLVIGVDFEQGGCTLIIDKKFVWRWTSGQLLSMTGYVALYIRHNAL